MGMHIILHHPHPSTREYLCKYTYTLCMSLHGITGSSMFLLSNRPKHYEHSEHQYKIMMPVQQD